MAVTTSTPEARSTGVESSSGGTEASEATPQITIRASRAARRTWARRMTAWARSGGSGRADRATNSRPTGVATTNPWLGWSSSTPGVAIACREKAGRGQEAERDEEQPRIGASQRDAARGQRERRARESGGEDQPE